MSLDFYVECLNCNTKYTNPINSLCSNCGKDIFTKDNNVKCSECGGEFESTVLSCPYCGTSNSKKSYIDLKDDEIITLVDSIESGDIDKVTKFIEKGIDVNRKYSPPYNLIHIAAEANQVEIIKLLVSYGADIEVESGLFEETAIVIAADLDNKEAVSVLIDLGAKSDEIDITKHIIKTKEFSYKDLYSKLILENKINPSKTTYNEILSIGELFINSIESEYRSIYAQSIVSGKIDPSKTTFDEIIEIIKFIKNKQEVNR